MMNAKELFPKFEEHMAKTYPREWDFVGDVFDYRMIETSEQIEEAFEYVETDRSIMVESYCQTYHYPEALKFFAEWADSSELKAVWCDAEWIDNGENETPEALLNAAREEFEETGPFDKRPLCDAVCEWNRLIIYDMLGLLVVVWEQMKKETE